MSMLFNSVLSQKILQVGLKQCDQNGRFLEVLGIKYTYKNSEEHYFWPIYKILGYFFLTLVVLLCCQRCEGSSVVFVVTQINKIIRERQKILNKI